MSVFGEKSGRVAVVNAICLALMVVLGVLLGTLTDKLALISIPVIIGVINIFMIVDYFATPHHMMSLFESDLTIRKSFGRDVRLSLKDIYGIVVTTYSRRSTAGILAIAVRDKRPIYINAVKDAESVKRYILDECARIGYIAGIDVSNGKNTNTSMYGKAYDGDMND